jgi:hypothetical protein
MPYFFLSVVYPDSLRSGSGISNESRSGYGSRVLMTKIEEKNISASKDEIYQLFFIFWPIFALLDPDLDCESGSGYGSRVPIESGSNPDPDTVPDPQHCFFPIQQQRYNFINSTIFYTASPAVPQSLVSEYTTQGLNPRTVTTFACTMGSQTLQPLDLIN